MIVMAYVSLTVQMSSQLDFKLRFLPHISTDAVQTIPDVKR